MAVSVQRARSFDGETAASALGAVLAHVRAIAANEEVGIEVEFDVVAGMPPRGVFHVIGIHAVESVDTRNGHGLVAVRKVFDVAKRSGRNEFVLSMDVGIEAEQVDGQLTVGGHQEMLHLFQSAHPFGAGSAVVDVFLDVAVTRLGHLPFPTAVDGNEQRVAAAHLREIFRSASQTPRRAPMGAEPPPGPVRGRGGGGLGHRWARQRGGESRGRRSGRLMHYRVSSTLLVVARLIRGLSGRGGRHGLNGRRLGVRSARGTFFGHVALLFNAIAGRTGRT